MAKSATKYALLFACLAMGSCSDGYQGYEDGGSSYAKISTDKNNPCRVMVSDMGRANPPVKPFAALIEGCKLTPQS